MNTSASLHVEPAPGAGLSYRMVAPSRADTPRIARDWVASVMRSAGHGELEERARLCASEVVTNAYRHTDTPEIGVEVAFTGDRVTVYVSDCAPERWPQGGGGGFGGLATCGRGLGLVAAYADDWAAVAQGECVKAVWFSLVVGGQRIATGATGVPVPPTKGSGIAERRKA
ncbi:ATP-binding protein [Streptomyces sp. NPDC001389]|uniref:ATP-binding protein n=1 Tax=unclassified Streptomyces TaxID=2593676 RepID=UPI0036BEBAFE